MIDLKNYKRLTTKKKERNIVYGNCDANNDSDFKGDYITGTIIDKIAELEDMIEQGKLVEKGEPKTELTKEQQIQEMADFITDSMLLGHNAEEMAEHLINNGYGKKEHIIKFFEKKLLENSFEVDTREYGRISVVSEDTILDELKYVLEVE